MSEDQEHKNVIVGGFLSHPRCYANMRQRIEEISGRETAIVQISPYLWYVLFFPKGWVPIVKKLERTLDELVKSCPDTRVTLIGHSIGGVLGLLYLIGPEFGGSKPQLKTKIEHLITLGSPHHNRRPWLHGGVISRLVKKHGGVERIGQNVRLTCVAGKSLLGNRKGTASEKKAYAIYKAIGGQGDVWGDGMIPTASALLAGANPILLKDVAHYSLTGKIWYGSPEAVSRWWAPAQSL